MPGIVCRPFLRVDRLWNAACATNSLSNYRFHYQGFSCDHKFHPPKMDEGKDGPNSKTLYKKRKTILPMWRPVSTQSVSHEECIIEDVKINSTHPCEAVDCTDEPTVGTALSSISSASVVNYEYRSEAAEGKQPIAFSGEMEVLSETQESFDSVTGSESFRDLHKVEVIEHKDAIPPSEKHSLPVEVDASLIRFIKGKGGSTQRQIEEETGVKIIFPSSKDVNYVVLEGISIETVTKASEKITNILEEAVKSPSLDYSHFISLPLAIHPELVEKLYNFQSSILGDMTPIQNGDMDSDSNEDTSDDIENKEKQAGSPTIPVKLEVQNETEHVRVKIETTSDSYDANKLSKSSSLSELGIDKSIFIKPKTFHLTVLMLKLWNNDRVAAAAEVLQNISSKVKDALDNRPVSIRLKGLECMRGSPAKARVLYAPVEEIGQEGRLLRACQVIVEAYVKAGLVLEKDAQQTLKLHATLMNAKHRKRNKRNKRRHDSFDARMIYERFGSEDWGDYLIREAHLSKRFVFDESGYYHCCASIHFPESMQLNE